MRYITGIDIGSEQISAAVGCLKKDNLKLIGFERQKSQGIYMGGVKDIEAASEAIFGIMKRVKKIARRKNDLFVCLSNPSVSIKESYGMAALSPYGRIVNERDVSKCIAIGQIYRLPVNRTVLHRIVDGFKLDSQKGIVNPVGMIGVKLSVKMKLITVDSSIVKNIGRCFENAGYYLSGCVYSGIACSRRALKSEEMLRGVLLVDM